MKLPKLQQLKYLVALKDTGHFGQAAKSCFVSQSTLSSAIQSLEEQLESQLIERDHRTFIFTSIGNDVVARARHILELSNELVCVTSSNGEQFNGDIHLGIIPTIAPFVLKDLIQSSQQTYPQLNLYLREDTSDNCISLLRSGQLDMVLLATPYKTQEFVEELLVVDPFYRVFSESRDDNAIYLLESEHCLSDHAITSCHLTSDSNIHPFQASSLTSLLAMVEGHQGETYLPKLAIKSGFLNDSNLSYQSMDDKKSARNISVIWRKTSNRRTFYLAISELIKSVLAAKLG